MKRLTSIAGYAAAGATVAAAVLTPFVFFNFFTGVVARAGLRVDPIYSGGEVARIIPKEGYRVLVYQPVPKRALLGREGDFVQLTWQPAAALPARVSDAIDLDGDNQPDLVAVFDVPRDARTELRVDVQPLNPRVLPMKGMGRDSFSSLIARVGDTIVVRAPLLGPRRNEEPHSGR